MKFKLLRGIGKDLHAKLGITAPFETCKEGAIVAIDPDIGESLSKKGLAMPMEPRPKPPAPKPEVVEEAPAVKVEAPKHSESKPVASGKK